MASTHILAVGKIVRDGIEMDVSMPPWVDPHESRPEGSRLPPLQDTIDYAADALAEEWEEYRLEMDWLDHGI